MAKPLKPFDPADYLDDATSIAAYLRELLVAGASQDDLLSALGRIAKAKGMSEVAKSTGLGRESLYKSLAAGARPEWATVVKVLGALGLTVAIVPTPPQKTKRSRKAA